MEHDFSKNLLSVDFLKELREVLAIDGANEIQHFFKIMLPVCKPIHRGVGTLVFCRYVE